ncbi:MAG TPA: MFS transporter [Gemmatimonadaceae bacterium]|jgi:AAA family ATP:ADP antiporter|nr:MFS transporter [Gemmatimonadaceae bacterium]
MADSPPASSPIIRAVQRVVDVREEEAKALAWSCAYFFFALSSYYIIRPVRDAMGTAGGTRNLQWLFLGTMTAMLLVHPPFGALVAKLPRRKFVAYANRFFVSNLAIFYLLLRVLPETRLVWVGRAFFIWAAVYNLFVISVFWSVMTDSWSTPQGKRLFGFIGVGGTLGGIVGSLITTVLAEQVGVYNLLLISALLLEVSTQAMLRVTASSTTAALSTAAQREDKERVIGGGVLAGIAHVVKSPYLLGICLYMLLYTFGSTVLYFQQSGIAETAFSNSDVRTTFFARIDLAVNVLTALTQIFLTGRIVKLLGVPITLTLLPALSVLGFLALAVFPLIGVLVAFQVLRRAGEYAVARPARELLYIVLPREDKYKAKNFIDTFVYRAGDQTAAWSMAKLTGSGLAMAGTALVAAPLALVWLVIGWWLGRQQEVRARPDSSSMAKAA